MGEVGSTEPKGDRRDEPIVHENGGGGMPAFKSQLTASQIADVATYVTQKTTQNNK